MAKALEGGCYCGEVRFRLQGPPILVHACHCRSCQKWSGSAFAVNVMVETDRLTLLSDGDREVVDGETRCPTCRVVLWAHHPALGDGIAFVKAGVLDDGGALRPDVHCFTRSKYPWIALPADARIFEAGYDAGEVLGPEARARIEAVRAPAD